MSSALLSREEEMFPDRIRWSVKDCYRLMDLGFLQGRYEILDGELISKMGQNPPHTYSVTQFTRSANRVFGDQFVRIQLPIALRAPDSMYSEPEPDIAVTHQETTAFSNRPGSDEIVLIIEVSDTSTRVDLLVKARLYARAGIREYWTLDLSTRSLHVHRNPVEGEYGEHIALKESEAVSPLAQPKSTLSISDVLPAA